MCGFDLYRDGIDVAGLNFLATVDNEGHKRVDSTADGGIPLHSFAESRLVTRVLERVVEEVRKCDSAILTVSQPFPRTGSYRLGAEHTTTHPFAQRLL